MTHDHINNFELTAVEIRRQLIQLDGERALAISTGVADIETYIADLDEEIEVWRSLYLVAAVTEIATLRAEISGAQAG